MKNQIEEGFLDKLFGMIAQGRVDRVTKKIMKDDPEFAKAVKTARAAHKRMDDRLRAKGLIK
jgi:hypothetical protein|tara:strand:- start:9537 stop:9722 length:186 start_codon:yes stop_codon:yes gene_type:complete